MRQITYKRAKRIVAFLVATVVISGLVVGCSEQNQNINIILEEEEGQNGEKEEKLTFLGHKADALDLVAIENSLHGFMDENEHITVTYESIKGTSIYWDAFEKRADTGNMDDIVMIDHDRMLALRAENMLADLSGLTTVDNFDVLARSQFVEEDGSVYFLPTCIAAYVLHVNLDMLEEHGQKVPTNLQEFTQVCDYFVSQGITPIVANNYTSLRSLIVAKGLYPVYQKEDPAGEIEKFNHGEADIVETLQPGIEMVGEMIEKGWFDCEEALVTDPISDDLDIFSTGERPFMIAGGWVSVRVSAMKPDFAYEVYPLPVLDDGSVLVEEVNTCVSVSADSAHLEDAKRLVEYLTRPDVVWEYCDSQNSFTPLKDDRIPADQTIAPVLPYLTNGQSVIGSDYRLKLPLDNALTKCCEEMLQGMSAEKALSYLSDLLDT